MHSSRRKGDILALSRLKKGREYHATEVEIKDLNALHSKLLSSGWFRDGAVKVVPPNSYVPTTKSLEEIQSTVVKEPYRMNVRTIKKDFIQFIRSEEPANAKSAQGESNKETTVADLIKLGQVPKALKGLNIEKLETEYWKKVLDLAKKSATKGSQYLCTYGSDADGSLMEFSSKKITLCNLKSSLHDVVRTYENTIPGVTVPFLYYGGWLTTFVIHTEDKDFCAISYNHYGCPKIWYTIEPEDARKLELLASEELAEFMTLNYGHACPVPFRHKIIMVELEFFERHDIKVTRHIQKAGELMLLPPLCYHFGFNAGFNVAESVNYAFQDWIFYGLLDKSCDLLKPVMTMEWFVYEFLYDRYKDYVNGEMMAYHPLDTSKELVKLRHEFGTISANDDCNIVISRVTMVLAVKTVGNVQYVYVDCDGDKNWLTRSEAEKLTWRFPDTPPLNVIVPNSLYNQSISKPAILASGIPLHAQGDELGKLAIVNREFKVPESSRHDLRLYHKGCQTEVQMESDDMGTLNVYTSQVVVPPLLKSEDHICRTDNGSSHPNDRFVNHALTVVQSVNSRSTSETKTASLGHRKAPYNKPRQKREKQMKPDVCPSCGTNLTGFKDPKSCYRHIRDCRNVGVFKCEYCHVTYSLERNLNSHMKSDH